MNWIRLELKILKLKFSINSEHTNNSCIGGLKSATQSTPIILTSRWWFLWVNDLVESKILKLVILSFVKAGLQIESYCTPVLAKAYRYLVNRRAYTTSGVRVLIAIAQVWVIIDETLEYKAKQMAELLQSPPTYVRLTCSGRECTSGARSFCVSHFVLDKIGK